MEGSNLYPVVQAILHLIIIILRHLEKITETGLCKKNKNNTNLPKGKYNVRFEKKEHLFFRFHTEKK